VEGINPFIDDEYNISRYNESIIRIKLLPSIMGRYGWSWDHSLVPSTEEKFNEISLKLQNWSKKNYD